MYESKDPAIKLFGKKIPLPADKDSPGIYCDESPVQPLERDLVADEEETESDKDLQPTTDGSDAENEVVSTENDKAAEEKKQSEEKQTTLKKPDKILPCPRCNSMDTKFCYYNNYNVNQPRHFCKACQRYWTAGGTMRNVPVGAGRRKNKNSASAAAAAAVHYHHVTISEALHAARPPPPPNGRTGVLSFSTPSNANANATHTGIDDCSSASSVTVSNSAEEMGGNGMEPNQQSVNAPCIQAVPWPPYAWNSAGPHGFPMPFYPFWNYAASAAVPGGAWNIPWFPPPFCPSNSPALGKHPRELDSGGGEEAAAKRRSGAVLVPKTLRFDDPIEAAKSSIWATLGIKNEGMFKAFQGKSDGEKKSDKRSNIVEPSLAHMANPAAMSRSLNFHETA